MLKRFETAAKAVNILSPIRKAEAIVSRRNRAKQLKLENHFHALAVLLLVLLLQSNIFNLHGAEEASSIKEWNVYPLDSDYYRPDDLLPDIIEMCDNFPHLADWYIIGESSNYKLPIYAIRLTDGKSRPKPSILLHGQHHAEEPVGVEIVMNFAKYLLENHKTDPFINKLLDEFEFWIVPTSNPEGFRVVNSGEYRLKRKNETDTNFNGIREVHLDGVDLNRNYDFNWHSGGGGDPESPYFKGYEPAGQKETQAMQSFYAQRRFNLAFFYHSSATGAYSERIFFPWRWGDKLSPDYYEMLDLAEVLSSKLPKTYTEGNYEVHRHNTSQRSFARDYIYSQHNTLAWLIEVGGNSPYGEGIVTPSNEVLQQHINTHRKAMLNLLQHYRENLYSFQVLDIDNRPVAGIEVVVDGKKSSRKNSITTCDEGYFFYYFLPGKDNNMVEIAGIEPFNFNLQALSDNHILIKADITDKCCKPYIEPLNDGEAVILVNPVFQSFDRLTINGWNKSSTLRNQLQGRQAYMSMLSNKTIAYRRTTGMENGSISVPWLPVDIIDRGVLTFQVNDVSPLTDELKAANKIVFLTEQEEVLSYCIKPSVVNRYYLHPASQIGIDYSLYPSGENDYQITKIKIYAEPVDSQKELQIALYDEAKPLMSGVAVFNGKDAYLAEINKDLPDNLFLAISNQGEGTVSIRRDTVQGVNSGRTEVYFSCRQPLKGADLAVAVYLSKNQEE